MVTSNKFTGKWLLVINLPENGYYSNKFTGKWFLVINLPIKMCAQCMSYTYESMTLLKHLKGYIKYHNHMTPCYHRNATIYIEMIVTMQTLYRHFVQIKWFA
jgi:hypothetical protein